MDPLVWAAARTAYEPIRATLHGMAGAAADCSLMAAYTGGRCDAYRPEDVALRPGLPPLEAWAPAKDRRTPHTLLKLPWAPARGIRVVEYVPLGAPSDGAPSDQAALPSSGPSGGSGPPMLSASDMEVADAAAAGIELLKPEDLDVRGGAAWEAEVAAPIEAAAAASGPSPASAEVEAAARRLRPPSARDVGPLNPDEAREAALGDDHEAAARGREAARDALKDAGRGARQAAAAAAARPALEQARRYGGGQPSASSPSPSDDGPPPEGLAGAVAAVQRRARRTAKAAKRGIVQGVAGAGRVVQRRVEVWQQGDAARQLHAQEDAAAERRRAGRRALRKPAAAAASNEDAPVQLGAQLAVVGGSGGAGGARREIMAAPLERRR